MIEKFICGKNKKMNIEKLVMELKKRMGLLKRIKKEFQKINESL